MSDDTPADESPSAPGADEPTVSGEPEAAPAASAAPGPEAGAPEAEPAGYAAPQGADAPTAAGPGPEAEPVTADQPAAVPPVAAAAPAAAAAAAAPAASPPGERRGVFVPAWVAIVVAILLIGGLGFAIGYITGDNNGSDSSNAASTQTVPTRPTPTRPTPNENGRGNTGNNGNGNNNGGNNNGSGSNGEAGAQTAFLGVSVAAAPNNGGAQVSQVSNGSPAANAGLKTGDVITKIGDTTVQSPVDVFRAIRSHQPGDQVTITYTRDGNSATATVTLGSRAAVRPAIPS